MYAAELKSYLAVMWQIKDMCSVLIVILIFWIEPVHKGDMVREVFSKDVP